MPLQKQPRIQQYTVSDGMPLNNANDLIQSRQGYLWVATFGGLARFDGVKFTRFPHIPNEAPSHELSSHRIIALLEDQRERLWVGTEDAGLSLLQEGQFIAIDFCERRCRIMSLAKDESHIYAATNVGAWKIEMASLQASLVPGFEANLSSLDLDHQGRLYASTVQGVLYETATGVQTIPRPAAVSHLSHIIVDGDDLLALTPTGVFAYRLAEGHWKKELDGHAMMQSRLRDGSIVVSLHNGEVWQRDPDGVYRLLLNLAPMTVSHALQDHENNLWLGTSTHGLLRLQPPWISTMLPPAQQGNTVAGGHAIASDNNGGVWLALGCHGLLHRQADGLAINVTTALNLNLRCTEIVQNADDDTLWAGSGGLLMRLRAATGEQLESGLLSDDFANISAIAPQPDGSLYVAMNQRTYHLQPDQDGHFLTDPQPVESLEGLTIRQFVPAREGGLWLVGDHGAWRWQDEKIVARWGEEQGLSSRFARALKEDPDGTLWIGTYGGGLNRIQAGQVHHYNRTNGLNDDTVSCLLSDHKDRLWLAGNRGISVVDPHTISPTSVHAIAFNEDHGLQPAEINGGRQSSCFKDEQGRFWFSLVRGFAMLDPRDYHPNPLPTPLTHIESSTLNGTLIPATHTLILGARDHTVRFDYTAIAFSTPDQLDFRFRLTPPATEWTQAGNQRSIIYPSLPWGQFAFQVQARRTGDDWPAQWEELRIERPAPWYQRPWVWLVSTALALILLLDPRWLRIHGQNIKASHHNPSVD